MGRRTGTGRSAMGRPRPWRAGGALLALLAALLAGGCDRPPHLDRLAANDTVLAFGDSLTHGTGAPPQQSYPARLARLIGRPVVNAGVPGETSAQGTRRLPSVLEEVRPALVLLCHGGNDILRGMDLSAARRNLEAMVEMVRATGAQVVLIGVPRRSLLLRDTAEFYGAVAQRMEIPLEDEALEDILGDDQLKSDAVHPNAEGYRRLALAVATLLEQAGALPP